MCGGKGYISGPQEPPAYDLRNLKYRTDDADGEKRRLNALNLALNVYQMGMRTGWMNTPDNPMSPFDIVPLADQMCRFVQGGWEPRDR